jgi:hypothetical protein
MPWPISTRKLGKERATCQQEIKKLGIFIQKILATENRRENSSAMVVRGGTEASCLVVSAIRAGEVPRPSIIPGSSLQRRGMAAFFVNWNLRLRARA